MAHNIETIVNTLEHPQMLAIVARHGGTDGNPQCSHQTHTPSSLFHTDDIRKVGVTGCLPETTPTDVVLTQILQIRRLLDQTINLHLVIQLFARPKIFTRKLLLDA